MKETGILYLFILIGMLSGCYDIECPDEIQTPYTEENLTYFPYVTGDTAYYFNESGGQQYYLTCIKDTLLTDSTIMPASEYCSNEEYLDVNQGKIYLFSSDIPHPFEKLKIKMLLSKYGENSDVDIFFGYETESDYSYNFLYTKADNSLSNRHADFSLIRYRDSVWINGEGYDSVYSICYSTRDDIRLHAYYDTIYYNKDGFLKFISSRSGYRLERLP